MAPHTYLQVDLVINGASQSQTTYSAADKQELPQYLGVKKFTPQFEKGAFSGLRHLIRA